MMYFNLTRQAVDYQTKNNCVINTATPVFTWGAVHSEKNMTQHAYHIVVKNKDDIVWDTGWINTSEQRATYNGSPLKTAEKYIWTLQAKDCKGNLSDMYEGSFFTPKFEKWDAEWITSKEDVVGKAKYFRKEFAVGKNIESATLMVCGIGLFEATLNGKKLDNSVFQPAFTNYKKLCYYTTFPVGEFLEEGNNCIGVVVGEGWRRNHGRYLDVLKRDIEFFGTPALTAELIVKYTDGSTDVIKTDESWLCGDGAIVFNHLFHGETYDENAEKTGWNLCGFKDETFDNSIIIEDVTERIEPQCIQPEEEQYRIKPVVSYISATGKCILDFGVNIAGYLEINIPKGMEKGSKIVVRHAENVLPNGDIDMKTSRFAEVKDTIVIGENHNADTLWHPTFTYHGFRYVELSDYPRFPKDDDIVAVAVYNSVDNKSFFNCGSSIANKIQENIVRTERDNIHGVATDCPQRDERMAWMNDATVRFEEMPYNFDVAKLFPKILADIVCEQGEDGSITCCAPRVYGERPADPVCSSFLVAGLGCLNFYNQTETIKKYYENFKAWNECLKANSTNGIVNYSYYGDWAGPADYCDSPENGARSTLTPGKLMSTGFHYYNYKLLEKFAKLLGYENEAEEHLKQAEYVKKAFLKKWWHGRAGRVNRGAQGEQAFALWLGIIPEDRVKLAARRLHEAVESVGYRITTGNITTRYLMDMLAKYGYVDDAWKIITNEKYPSFGYMIQNGATTIWERFELKRFSTMNSHNHPMYGAVGYWFYSYIAGIKPAAPGFKVIDIAPHIPKDLLFAEAKVDTIAGEIYVKWEKKFGYLNLYVDIPFNTTANISILGNKIKKGSGSHFVQFELEDM